MQFKTVTELTQKAIAQTLGETYMTRDGELQPIESYNLVDVGKDVEDMENGLDKYVKALLVQVGKIVVESKKYTAELPSLFIETFDWGGFIERIYFSPQDVVSDDMWSLVDGQTYDDTKFYEPNVIAKIYQEAKAVMVPISRTEEQAKMAFRGWDEMNRFISGIMTNVENTITLIAESYAHMLVSCAVAISVSGTQTARHLATEYYTTLKGQQSLPTLTEMKEDTEFIKYCDEQIATTRANMRTFNTAFNNGSIPTFTQDEDSKLVLLSQFVNANKFKVKADTYNRDEIGFGDFDEITKWQAFKVSGKSDFDFDTVSTVKIAADSNNKLGIGTSAFTQAGVIGLLYDRKAIGISIQKQKVTTNYVGVADFMNYYFHLLYNYCIDANFPMVAFVLD